MTYPDKCSYFHTFCLLFLVCSDDSFVNINIDEPTWSDLPLSWRFHLLSPLSVLLLPPHRHCNNPCCVFRCIKHPEQIRYCCLWNDNSRSQLYQNTEKFRFLFLIQVGRKKTFCLNIQLKIILILFNADTLNLQLGSCCKYVFIFYNFKKWVNVFFLNYFSNAIKQLINTFSNNFEGS